MVLNQLFFGIRPITSITKLSPFFYRGVPLGPLLNIECQKDYLKASVEVPPSSSVQATEKQVVTPFRNAQVVDAQSNRSNPLIYSRVSGILNENWCKKPKSRWLPPDTLFWNIFIAVHGESEFLQIGTKYANREWEEKNLIRKEIAKNPKAAQTTNHKITLKNVQEMMSEYMTGICVTSLLGLVGFSVYYKVPIHLVDPVKKTHLSFLPMNTEREPCFLIKTEGRYELSSEPVSLDDSFNLESYTRPLRAISSYKRVELEDIRSRLRVDVSSDLPKEGLYRALSEHLVWK